MVHWVYHVSWKIHLAYVGALLDISPVNQSAYEKAAREDSQPKNSLIFLYFLVTGVSYRIPAAWASYYSEGGPQVSNIITQEPVRITEL